MLKISSPHKIQSFLHFKRLVFQVFLFTSTRLGSMENIGFQDEKIEFPTGFEFHPTDKELINHYLTKKVADSNFTATAIAEVDMNKSEPWDLPRLAKMGETEWYFFSLRDRKYSIGQNRATIAGYWKAKGQEKQIIKEHTLIGMKKTLVFYKGEAPKGEKTNWVMHEYRLEDKKYDLPRAGRNEWVICRVYKKDNRGKKVQNGLGMLMESGGSSAMQN